MRLYAVQARILLSNRKRYRIRGWAESTSARLAITPSAYYHDRKQSLIEHKEKYNITFTPSGRGIAGSFPWDIVVALYEQLMQFNWYDMPSDATKLQTTWAPEAKVLIRAAEQRAATQEEEVQKA